MAVDRYRFDTGLSGHDLDRLTRALADVPGVVSDDAGVITIDDLDVELAFETWVERLLAFNRAIHRRAARGGRPIKPYKPRDLVNLYAAVLMGVHAGESAAVVHEVTWRQPFANANHRTATAAFAEHEGIAATASQLRAATEEWFVESKRLLDGSDAAVTDEQAKAAHLAAIRSMCEAIQSIR